LKADPSRAVSPDRVRARIAAEHNRSTLGSSRQRPGHCRHPAAPLNAIGLHDIHGIFA
jgi:hypothetical protein